MSWQKAKLPAIQLKVSHRLTLGTRLGEKINCCGRLSGFPQFDLSTAEQMIPIHHLGTMIKMLFQLHLQKWDGLC